MKPKRIESIDVLRGIVMVIMALDHVRDYFHVGANTGNPLNLETTTPILFFTRWITHFCAPVFVFLSGTSIYLQSLRKTKKELSVFLVKRGLWLILVEVVIISFAWSFNPDYDFFFLQVIWAIGISMVLLGLLIHLPFRFILFLGLLIVFGHNLLDIPESDPGFKHGFLWDLLHGGFFSAYPLWANHMAMIVYPFVPWTGVMLLGYCIGAWFAPNYDAAKRARNLTRLGMGLIAFFIVLRFLNIYGDPLHWSAQKNGFYSFLSFINVQKYPPSLLYLCLMLGPAILLLPFLEKLKNKFTRAMGVYGRVAFFYYVVHIYLVHFISAIGFFLRGHTWAEVKHTGQNYPFNFLVPGEGYDLPMVYFVWAFVVIALFPFCKWYDQYKTSHKEKWWLSYL
ncbi:DUF1624 domain-containing protein [Flavihumibacter fluvii]|uniref:DUF1624 domain-containing protein n=1 Tax=Flavihumibacter fluvii TaxID=2838157 RepID=UPI001BDE36EE|nr:heparan-alpha-glucosaminide N-acetyltransferase domain-containing protein [Flavihumibacter fluvii]ULQ52982.1 heparan-alpha-glucosaminide N-acetyltransferase domain-containing protein [Flavihumibacter fluvii]